MGSDADSYRRYLDGDDNGFIEITIKYRESLLMYINSIVRNFSEAEEILQDTFVKIAVKKPKYNPDYSFKTWLYTIARNCAYNRLKFWKRFSGKSVYEYSDISDEAVLEKNYLLEEQKIELNRAMKKLKAEYSHVLFLIYFEELSTEEAAKIMHKNKNNIGVLVFRARNALKAELEKEGFEYEEF